MSKVFIITGTWGGPYEGSDWNICATASKAKAEDISNRLNQWMRYNLDYKAKQMEFEQGFRAKHPIIHPYHMKPSEAFKKAHNACISRGGGSEKDKARYRQLQKEHIQAKEAARIEHDKFLETLKEELKQFRLINYHLPPELEEVKFLLEDDGAYLSGDTTFSYEEMDLVE